MRSVTDGTGEARIDVFEVMAPALIQFGQVVALSAQGIGSDRAQVRIGIQVLSRNRLARSWRLTERIRALENMAVLGAMRPVRTAAARLSTVVVVVTLSALGGVRVLVQGYRVNAGKSTGNQNRDHEYSGGQPQRTAEQPLLAWYRGLANRFHRSSTFRLCTKVAVPRRTVGFRNSAGNCLKLCTLRPIPGGVAKFICSEREAR